MSRALRCCHENVNISRRNYLLISDIEAVSKGQSLAGGQVRSDVLGIHVGLLLIVDEDHDNVSLLGSLGHGVDLEAVLLCHGPGLAALAQADDHVAAGVTQVQRMGVTLGAVTDDGNLLAV